MKPIAVPAIGLVLIFAFAHCGNDKTPRELVYDCQVEQGEGPRANGSELGGVKVVWKGKNGTFRAACKDGKVSSYACSRTSYTPSPGSHLGPNPGDYSNDGAVVPVATFSECERFGGECADGACFWPPIRNYPRCTTHPPPCGGVDPNPDRQLDPPGVCCLSGKGKAFSCSTSGAFEACRFDDATDRCVPSPELDSTCYGPNF